jgi:hypothetical protein
VIVRDQQTPLKVALTSRIPSCITAYMNPYHEEARWGYYTLRVTKSVAETELRGMTQCICTCRCSYRTPPISPHLKFQVSEENLSIA